MKIRRFRSSIALPVLFGSMLCSAPARGENARSDEWRLGITPYLWLPTVNGDFQFRTPAIGPGGGLGGRLVNISSELGPNDYLSDLEFALMVAGSAQKGRWSLLGDLTYVRLDSEGSRVRRVGAGSDQIPIGANANLGTRTDLDVAMLTLMGGYQVLDSDRVTGSLLAGVRHVEVEANLAWNLQFEVTGTDFVLSRQGRVARDAGLTDALVGFRGRLALGEGSRWSAPFHVDLGAGSSDLTWQAMAGVAYALPRSEVLVVYRHVGYEGDEDQELVQDLQAGGLAVGWTFRF